MLIFVGASCSLLPLVSCTLRSARCYAHGSHNSILEGGLQGEPQQISHQRTSRGIVRALQPSTNAASCGFKVNFTVEKNSLSVIVAR